MNIFVMISKIMTHSEFIVIKVCFKVSAAASQTSFFLYFCFSFRFDYLKAGSNFNEDRKVTLDLAYFSSDANGNQLRGEKMETVRTTLSRRLTEGSRCTEVCGNYRTREG